MAFYQLFHLIWHEIDRFGCFILRSGFFSKSLVKCLTHSLLEILPKTRFEASRVVFWSLSCYKELKLTTNRFTGSTLHRLRIQKQNISLRSSGMRRKQNFPSFFAFLASFFSLAGHLVGFILVGRVFRKAFRILGLGERKVGWAIEQDFHRDFQVNVTWFFASFSGVLDWIVLILVWCERSLHSTQG